MPTSHASISRAPCPQVSLMVLAVAGMQAMTLDELVGLP